MHRPCRVPMLSHEPGNQAGRHNKTGPYRYFCPVVSIERHRKPASLRLNVTMQHRTDHHARIA